MNPILTTEDIKKLKTDERLVECSSGKVSYYRFLCFHPRNPNYVILLDCCEEPVRVYCKNLIDRFFTDYTRHDILIYCRDYASEKIKKIEQELSELDGKNNLED